MTSATKAKPAVTTLLNTLTGHIAMWAVRQSPYPCPDYLEVVVARFYHLAALTDGAKRYQESVCFQFDSVADLEKLLRDTLYEIPEFLAWNKPKSGHDQEHVFVSRLGGPAADDDFIDLDTFVRNVVHTVAEEEAQKS